MSQTPTNLSEALTLIDYCTGYKDLNLDSFSKLITKYLLAKESEEEIRAIVPMLSPEMCPYVFQEFLWSRSDVLITNIHMFKSSIDDNVLFYTERFVTFYNRLLYNIIWDLHVDENTLVIDEGIVNFLKTILKRFKNNDSVTRSKRKLKIIVKELIVTVNLIVSVVDESIVRIFQIKRLNKKQKQLREDLLSVVPHLHDSSLLCLFPTKMKKILWNSYL